MELVDGLDAGCVKNGLRSIGGTWTHHKAAPLNFIFTRAISRLPFLKTERC